MEGQGVDCEELRNVETMRRLAREGKIRTLLDASLAAANAKLEAKGFEQGFREGLEKGLKGVREQLLVQAEQRFGATTAERLAACLADVREYDRLLAIGGWIVDCASGSELLDRVEGRA